LLCYRRNLIEVRLKLIAHSAESGWVGFFLDKC